MTTKRKRVHQAPNLDSGPFAAHNARAAEERAHKKLVAKYTREAPKKRLRFRPRSPLAFRAKAKASAKRVLQEAKEHGGKRGEFRYHHRLRPTKTRSQTPWQVGLPGLDVSHRKPYTGAPIARLVLRDDAPKPSVIDLGKRQKTAAARAPKAGKASIQELTARGVKLRLKPAPYSKENLTDGNFLNLHPYKGGWIITHEGVNLGSVKKLKSGWKRSGYHSNGSPAEQKMNEATAMLDEYYDAGGK